MEHSKKNKPKDFEAVLGYMFVDPRLLDEALTHRSFVNETGRNKSARDNQRLEFFGDAVIDFILSGMLLQLFPDSREGELTKIRATLVDEESLAGIASGLGLGAFLKLGRGEEKSGGREKRSILADAYEALIAAVYLDGGLGSAQRLVETHLGPFLKDRNVIFSVKDHKTDFQELAQVARNATPRYVLTEVSGPDHNRFFTVAVYLGAELMGEGSGRSKKEAEQAAAKIGAERLKLDTSSARL